MTPGQDREAAAGNGEKARLRRALRARLSAIESDAVNAASVAIAERVRSLPVWAEAPSVVLFASLPGEVDTALLIAAALEEGRSVLLPRVVAHGQLEFAACTDVGELVTGRYGVREPPPRAAPVPLGRDMLVCVPGLGFDRAGGRLGRGAGYYDRALASGRGAERTPVLLGLAFQLQLVARVPMSPLDVRMDGVVTEESVWTVGAPSGVA